VNKTCFFVTFNVTKVPFKQAFPNHWSYGALPEKDRVFCSGVPHELDHLVQEDGDGGNAHAVWNAQNRSGFEQRVPETKVLRTLT
jgi:hypothetical protein